MSKRKKTDEKVLKNALEEVLILAKRNYSEAKESREEKEEAKTEKNILKKLENGE